MENNEIDKKLKSKDIKPTAMRTLVYKTLAESGKALSLADLEQRFEKAERSTIFRATLPACSPATVPGRQAWPRYSPIRSEALRSLGSGAAYRTRLYHAEVT